MRNFDEVYAEQQARIDAKFNAAVAAYRAGQPVTIQQSMGSCHCGSAVATLQDGQVKCHGREAWQNYAGPVAGFEVGYGLANLAKAIAAGEKNARGYQGSYIAA